MAGHEVDKALARSWAEGDGCVPSVLRSAIAAVGFPYTVLYWTRSSAGLINDVDVGFYTTFEHAKRHRDAQLAAGVEVGPITRADIAVERPTAGRRLWTP